MFDNAVIREVFEAFGERSWIESRDRALDISKPAFI